MIRITISAAAFDAIVLEALLWGFHNAASGLCYPGYEAIAIERVLGRRDERAGNDGEGQS